MRVLAIDASSGACVVGIIEDGRALAQSEERGDVDGRAPIARLAPMVAGVLSEADLGAHALDLVAVVVGPGGFSGIRAALALAHGLALAGGVELVGVTVGEVLDEETRAARGGRALWVATDTRRGAFFLERDGVVETVREAPLPRGAVAVAGEAAVAVMASLAARGADVMLTGARRPTLGGIVAAGVARADGRSMPRAAQPLYVDPPEARAPAVGLRRAPEPFPG